MAENNTSTAVDRALSMIELVAKTDRALSNSEFSQMLKIPKSSASNILRVLENRGYLDRDKSGKYSFGLKFMSLSVDATTRLDIREMAKPILRRFLKKSKLPEAHIAVLDNGRAVYVEKVESDSSFVKMDIWVGHRLPVHTTSIGKAIVSYLSDKEILEILEIRGMQRKTRKSITSTKGFLREAEKVRKYGFALDNEENSNDVRCIAAPIYDRGGNVIAALGTSSTILEIDDERLPKVVELVKDAAMQVSRKLGFSK